MIGISNTSPLIYLGKIGALHLLPSLFEKIFTSEEVVHELLDKEESFERPALQAFLRSHVNVQNPTNSTLLNNLKALQLHSGEASVIALAKEMQTVNKEDRSILIIDDLAAREVVTSLNIPLTGTIGVILRAAKVHVITQSSAQKLIDSLVLHTNFHLSTSLYIKIKQILQQL